MFCLLHSNTLFVSSLDGIYDCVNRVAISFLLLVLINRLLRLLRLSRLNLLFSGLIHLGLFLNDRLRDDFFDLRNRLNLQDLLDDLRLGNDRLGRNRLWLLVHDDTAVGNEPLSAPISAVTGAKSVHL